MMTLIIMAFVVVVSALLQTSLPVFAVLGHVKFPFLLSVVLYYALSRGSVQMLAAAFMAGLLQDILTPLMPLGYSVMCFCIIGAIVGMFREWVLTESIVTWGVFGGAAGIAFTLLMYVMLLKGGLVICPVRRAILKAVASGLLASVCTPIVFVVTARMDGVVGNIEVKESIHGFE